MLVPTKNQFGSMHPLTEISKVFLKDIKNFSQPIIDVGCAYGNFVIPALEQGNTVIGVDIEQQHLDILAQALSPTLYERFTALCQSFPDKLYFEPESLGAVHIAFVLSFFTGEQIVASLEKIYQWLVKDGKLCIINHSPYLTNIIDFIPEFELRKRRGDPWPGYIEDLPAYFSKTSQYKTHLPTFAHVFDTEVLSNVLTSVGFHVEQAKFCSIDNLPLDYKLDGREFVGIIARK